ncbi:MAG: EamA family transporter [Pseudomonadota bacterium]
MNIRLKANKGHVDAILAAIFATTIPIFSRGLEQDGWSLGQIVGCRGFVGALFLGIVFYRHLKSIREDFVVAIVYAVLLATSMILWIFSVIHTPLGVALPLLFISPIWVVLYEYLV